MAPVLSPLLLLAKISFTQGVFDKSILKNQTIFTIENDEEKVYVFLNLVPVYQKGLITYDLIRKISDAPNGVLDMLLCKTFLFLKDIGYEKMDIGLAPMSGMSGNYLKEKQSVMLTKTLEVLIIIKACENTKRNFIPGGRKHISCMTTIITCCRYLER